MYLSQEQRNQLKIDYPAGTRVELIGMNDFDTPPKGTQGTVKSVDDIGTIHVKWDSGSTHGLIYGVDKFKKI